MLPLAQVLGATEFDGRPPTNLLSKLTHHEVSGSLANDFDVRFHAGSLVSILEEKDIVECAPYLMIGFEQAFE